MTFICLLSFGLSASNFLPNSCLKKDVLAWGLLVPFFGNFLWIYNCFKIKRFFKNNAFAFHLSCDSTHPFKNSLLMIILYFQYTLKFKTLYP